VSSVSNTAQITLGAAPPATPTNLTATAQPGPQVLLAWTDNATTESGFVAQRCAGAGCVDFAQIATPGAFTGTGAVNYTDTGVVPGTTYRYQVAAINSGGQSSWSNIASVYVPNPPAPPTNAVAICRRVGSYARCAISFTDNSTNETGFTVQRSRYSTFVGGGFTSVDLPPRTGVGTVVIWEPGTNLPRNTDQYFRVRSFNADGTSVWVNAQPFPIRTP
jgi:predicted phage tail protein